MTLDEFLTELQREIPWNWWTLNKDGEIRFFDPRFGVEFCPITYINYLTTNHTYQRWKVYHAAHEIGIGIYEASEIVCAADNLSTDLAGLDYRLLQACGIFV